MTLSVEEQQQISPNQAQINPNQVNNHLRSGRGGQNRSRSQKPFFIAIVIVTLILIPFTNETNKTIIDYQSRQPTGYQWNSISDFSTTIIVSLSFFIFEYFFIRFADRLYRPICKEQKDVQIQNRKTKKAVRNLYRFLYYICSSIFGYICLKDSYFFPRSLGGSGSLYDSYKNFPYVTPPPLYNLYFTGTLGYHIGDLVHHIFTDNRGNDYLEMLLHHLVTIYLYSFSYMTHTLGGAVIAFLHDVSDIGISWTRTWAESIYPRLAGYSYMVSLIVWVYTRLIIFPQCIYVLIIKIEVYSLSPYLHPTFGFLLICLFLLHVYWSVLMFKLLIFFIITGSSEDTIINNTGNQQYSLQVSQKSQDQAIIKEESTLQKKASEFKKVN